MRPIIGDCSIRRLSHQIAFVLMLFTAGHTAAQTTARPPNTYRQIPGDTVPTTAPVVHADGTVTFSLRAPQASRVEFTTAPGQPILMNKREDGVWTITVGPLTPDTYRYRFLVDGVPTTDQANPAVDIGRSNHFSLLDVPSSPPRLDEHQDVPSGSFHLRDYFSKSLNAQRRMGIYLPPSYEAEPQRRYPVLYLRHGNGDSETSWTQVGRATAILDNLIAQRKAVSMIVVTLNGYPSDRDNGSTAAGRAAVETELITDIIPLIENRYRARAARDDRAIAGYSMGGDQAFVTAMRHPELFAWVGEFSGAFVSDVRFDLNSSIPDFAPDARRINSMFRLIFLGCGTSDELYAGHLDLVDRLNAAGINHVWFSTDGAHQWSVWRRAFAQLLPQLFQPKR